MNTYLILLWLFALTVNIIKCAPLNTVIIKSSKNNLANESYTFSYDLSDGTSRFEEGILEDRGSAKVFTVTGFYKYRAPDGKIYFVNYSSTPENGYRATLASNSFL